MKLQDNIVNLFNDWQEDYFFSHASNEYFTSDDLDGPGEVIYYYQDFKLGKTYSI